MKLINSRTKGAGGEREFARLLAELTGHKPARNLEQSRNGGHDLLATDPDHPLNHYALEVKRYSRITPALQDAWWQQAVGQAERAGLTPALAYRGDRQPWLIRVPLFAVSPFDFGHQHHMTITVETFAEILCGMYGTERHHEQS